MPTTPARFRLPAVLVLAAIAAALVAAPAVADDDDGDDGPTLVVTGEGSVDVTPDRAIVSFGVVAESEEAAAAQLQVNDTMADAIKAVKKAGIPDTHIATTGLQLHPRYKHNKSTGQSSIDGYRASMTLSVTVDKIDQAGEVIDAALEAGVNQFQGITFTVKDNAAAQQVALAAAAASARGKAKAIADAMGVKLAGVAHIAEDAAGHRPPQPYPAARMAMADAAVATPVQPGQLTITAQLTVTYRIAE